MDVVYFMGPHSDTELRYSLRSVAANVEHDNVWFLGLPPAWVTNANVIDYPFSDSKFHALYQKHLVLTELDIDTVFSMDDDMYVLDKVDETLPPLFEGWLEYRSPVTIHDNYQSFIEVNDAAVTWLRHEVEKPLKIGLHVPRVYHKNFLLDLKEKLSSIPTIPLMWRQLYGNLYGEPEQIMTDVKVFTEEQFESVLDYDTGFLSSHESALPVVEDYLADLFPDPCQYEDGAG